MRHKCDLCRAWYKTQTRQLPVYQWPRVNWVWVAESPLVPRRARNFGKMADTVVNCWSPFTQKEEDKGVLMAEKEVLRRRVVPEDEVCRLVFDAKVSCTRVLHDFNFLHIIVSDRKSDSLCLCPFACLSVSLSESLTLSLCFCLSPSSSSFLSSLFFHPSHAKEGMKV